MTTTTGNDMNERKARLAYADEANWSKLRGVEGRFDPAFGFEWAPYASSFMAPPPKTPVGAGPSDLTVIAPTGTS